MIGEWIDKARQEMDVGGVNGDEERAGLCACVIRMCNDPWNTINSKLASKF